MLFVYDLIIYNVRFGSLVPIFIAIIALFCTIFLSFHICNPIRWTLLNYCVETYYLLELIIYIWLFECVINYLVDKFFNLVSLIMSQEFLNKVFLLLWLLKDFWINNDLLGCVKSETNLWVLSFLFMHEIIFICFSYRYDRLQNVILMVLHDDRNTIQSV